MTTELNGHVCSHISLKDVYTNTIFLIDTGASVHILPKFRKSDLVRKSEYALYGANWMKITKHSNKILILNLDLHCTISHHQDAFPCHYNILVDVRNKILINNIIKLELKGNQFKKMMGPQLK